MPSALVQTGMELEYDTFGSPDEPALLLIMGFTAQMTAWEEAFCQILADGGRYVIRFDNRDSGLSTKLHGQVADVPGAMAAAFADMVPPPLPYTLGDMAADAVGLLDHLGIERAHVMGASMGGMIAQTVAINHPDRVRSLISVMSQPGEPEVGQPAPEAAEAIFAQPPTTREGYIEAAPRWMVWQSKKYRNEARSKELAAREFDRSFYPEGAPRQLAAIYGSGRRTAALQALDVPTDAGDPRPRRSADHAQRRFPYRRADPGCAPAVRRRHGSRPARAAVAADHGCRAQPHVSRLTLRRIARRHVAVEHSEPVATDRGIGPAISVERCAVSEEAVNA